MLDVSVEPLEDPLVPPEEPLVFPDEPLVLPEEPPMLPELEVDEGLEDELEDEDGLLEDDEPDEPPPWTPSAASVCESRLPLEERLCCCWNCCSACWVSGPMMPSTFTL
jgi:hypothetical protein